jgi:hypothetical protein
MSNTLLKLKIDLLKIPSAVAKDGKDGRKYLLIDIVKSGLFDGKAGLYLDVDMRENRDGEDQYGNSHMLVMSPTKEQRESKEKTPILGNAKTLVFPDRNMPHTSAPKARDGRPHTDVVVPSGDDEDGMIPF